LPNEITTQEWYGSLVDDCKAIMTEAVFNSRWALLAGYHAVGKRIATDKKYQEHAKGNKSSVADLGRKLSTSAQTIYRAIQFYNKFPDLEKLPGGKNMTWNKVIALLPAPKVEELPAPQDKSSLDEWGVKTRQVWTLGRHRVLCGDAYASKATDRFRGGEVVNALITDPPYGIGYKPDWNKWDGSISDFKKIKGDDQDFDPAPFMGYPTVLFFGANYFSQRLPLGGWLCWDKRLDENKDQMFGSPFELAWYRSVNTTKKAIMVRILHGGVVNADSTEGNNEKRLHTTQKPVALMQAVLEALTMPEDVILDPFAGSGSTLFACEATNRSCIAIEIEPDYVAVILQRWYEKTGEKPCMA
jgi:DNA modification methylase